MCGFRVVRSGMAANLLGKSLRRSCASDCLPEPVGPVIQNTCMPNPKIELDPVPGRSRGHSYFS